MVHVESRLKHGEHLFAVEVRPAERRSTSRFSRLVDGNPQEGCRPVQGTRWKRSAGGGYSGVPSAESDAPNSTFGWWAWQKRHTLAQPVQLGHQQHYSCTSGIFHRAMEIVSQQLCSFRITSSLRLHEFGEPFPTQTAFLDAVAGGTMLPLLTADQQRAQLAAIRANVKHHILGQYKLLGDFERNFMGGYRNSMRMEIRSQIRRNATGEIQQSAVAGGICIADLFNC
ncbi:MAG: hypothetical protein JSS49_26835 [Planctomycetes bacterium]|nr:hypothetical protein [Planctomycetota bacterium]